MKLYLEDNFIAKAWRLSATVGMPQRFRCKAKLKRMKRLAVACEKMKQSQIAATKKNVDLAHGFVLPPREFAERCEVSLKCEINRYGRRLASAFADRQQQADMEKFFQAIEQLAEEVERVERRLALMERAN